MHLSARFVRTLGQEIIDWLGWLLNLIIGYVFGKLLDFSIKRYSSSLRRAASRLSFSFLLGIGVLAFQTLTRLGYISSPNLFNVPIIDDFIFFSVVLIGLLLAFFGLSTGSRYPAVRVSRRKH
jgi:hypothetical protein